MAANKNAVRNSGIKQGLGFQEVGQTGNLAGGLSKERSKENLVEEIDVGSRLRELRTNSGFSLRSLAKLSGLNINTLSLIENGKTSTCPRTADQEAWMTSSTGCLPPAIPADQTRSAYRSLN